MSGKLLMFAKLCLKSFIYKISVTFCFPEESIKEIYKKHMIDKVEIFHVLTDTDSTSLKFMFISKPNSEVPEDKFRAYNLKLQLHLKYIKDLTLLTIFGIFLGPEKKINEKN